MRVQSLWSNLQGIPDPLFYIQGVASERLISQIQPAWRPVGFRAGFISSKRDSRPTQRFSQYQQEREAKKGCVISSSSQRSKAKIEYTSRNR